MFAFFSFLGVGFLLCITAWYYKKYPPKKINHFYGYRTKRTMANQEVWDFANKVGAKMILLWGTLYILIIGIVYWFVSVNVFLMVSIVAIVISCIISFIWSESVLNKYFDKNGNPINKN